jgi:hypothetical protein
MDVLKRVKRGRRSVSIASALRKLNLKKNSSEPVARRRITALVSTTATARTDRGGSADVIVGSWSSPNFCS